MRGATRECVAVGVSLFVSAVSGAQAQTREIRLGPPNATLSEGFSEIMAVRELSDGRVLIGDRRENRIVVADFGNDSVVPTARAGVGPGEHTRVSAIWPLGADSSLMVDVTARRWHIFAGTTLSRLIPPDAAAYVITDGSILGADTVGGLLAHVPDRFERSRDETSTRDSTRLRYVSLAGGTAEEIAIVRSSAIRVQSSGNTDGRPAKIRLEFPVFGVGEESLLLPDGWLAIGRLDPYRVDWRSPEGEWRRGEALPFTAIAVTSREKAAYRSRRERAGGRPGSPADDALWMPTIPPFQKGGLIAAPNGNLLVARTPSAAAPEPRYDEVDRQGQLVRQILLAPQERIVGIGPKSIYVAATDEVGLQHVRRHDWP